MTLDVNVTTLKNVMTLKNVVTLKSSTLLALVDVATLVN